MNVLSKEKKTLLLGNEAVVRGALEAGVDFITTYPGTPASEIGNSFYAIQQSNNRIKQSFYFEYSANEKVAMEAVIGASFSGLKTLVAMKHFGLNVAQEALLPFVFTGVVGPAVIVVSDDPSCHSSAQSEQNSRAVSYLGHIPTLEPADPQEAKDFTKLAFEISEKFNIPVMVRLTTRVSHQQMPVELGSVSFQRKRRAGNFKKNPQKFITMPPRVLEMKTELLEKINNIREFSEKSRINKEDKGRPNIGIIASGISYLYAQEALKDLKINIPVLKLGFFYPLPEKKIKAFIKKKEKILVVEELEPWIETEISRLAKDVNCGLKIQGKDILPVVGEFNPEIVKKAIARLAGIRCKTLSAEPGSSVPRRGPKPCPGCPYWATFGAVKEAISNMENEVVFGGDIGCYMLAGIPQLGLQDYLFCMGSSLGIGHGIKKANPNQKLIAFIGDSTFFHAGMPALANMVANKSNALIIIMDNRTTAMTGQQPNPGAIIKIEKVISGLGVKNIKVINPSKQRDSLVETIKSFLKKKEISVIIARSPCLFIR